MKKHNETFEYTYSATQQEEIERIRSKYLPKEETKLEKLRKLDREVTQKGTIWSIALGVIGTMIFGAGMSACMVLGTDVTMFALGVVLGIIGAVILGMAYPVYKKITEKEKIRIAPQILALTEEIEAESSVDVFHI